MTSPEDEYVSTAETRMEIDVQPGPYRKGDVVPVALRRTDVPRTRDQILWTLIRNRTNALSFERYARFVDLVICGDDRSRDGHPRKDIASLRQHWADLRPFGADAYGALKATTEYFLMHEVGIVTLRDVDAEEESGRLGRSVTAGQLGRLRNEYYDDLRQNGRRRLPYIDLIIDRLPEIPIKDVGEVSAACYGISPTRLTGPLALELIWSYWHDEGMLSQAFNAVALRFQNIRNERVKPDPLARLEIDPLRPLNNILWGFVQDEWDRLSVVRRAYEYDHEYGLTLIGKAIPKMRTADSRSQFLGAFHNLLYLCSQFYREDDDTTVVADGFPILNALKEVHIILAHGAHNQFGDLPWTARVEMLIQQWLLGRPEMREFLGGRVMVPYKEPWMDRVDAVKSMMGWNDISVTHFHDLAVFGEQILLSIRYASWTEENNAASAGNWARYWRPEIQGYVHGYRAVTGVDLTERSDDTIPALHLRRRHPGLNAGAVDPVATRGRGRRRVPAQPARELEW
ncbi:MAG TPA: hypothetical protein VM784_01750 [Actinomycetota bacterium]|nr:hypothetical protein [Actinomycetota bacterium]